MNIRKIFTVYKKEILDTIRDNRTLMVMILLPLILYPALIIFSSQIQIAGQVKLEREASTVSVKGNITPLFDSLLKSDSLLKMIDSKDPSEDLKNGSIMAYIEKQGTSKLDSIKLYYDGAVERSSVALERLKDVTERYKTLFLQDTIMSLGIDTGILNCYPQDAINIAAKSRMGSYILGMLIPMLLIMTIAIGAMYPAIDLTAGEKERGTMETILTVPIKKNELFIGKYLTVCTIAMITGCANLFSMILTFSMGFVQLGAVSGDFEFTLPFLSIGIIFLLMIPLSMFISSVLMIGAVFARSFKDAQNLMTPILIILIVPAISSIAPGIELNDVLSLVPILNLTLLLKNLFLNIYNTNHIFLVFLSNIIFAAGGVISAAHLFGREEVLLGDGKGLILSINRKKMTPSQVATPGAGILVYAISMILLFYAGTTLQSISCYAGLALTEWGIFFLPPVMFAWYFRLNIRKSFNLRMFKAMSLVGTILLCLGTLVLVAFFNMIQASFLTMPTEMAEAFRKFFDVKESGMNPSMMFFLVSISPAICEEVLFRGILFSSLKNHLKPLYVIFIVSLLFAIAHMNLFRLMPTFTISIVLTFVVYRTGSIYLSMIGHALINGFVVALVCFPSIANWWPWLKDLTPPVWLILSSIVFVIGGIAIIVVDTRIKNISGRPVAVK